ncbi:MAG: hypothetical protein K2X76_13030, partial [Sphingomonas sp.]|nr:hypothetical protein [Sphingomonas sp.]
MKQFHLLAAASTLAIFHAAPVFAQSAPAQDPAAQQSQTDAAAQAPAAQTGDQFVQEDVVVSATKTDKTLLDTPISVDVVSGARIQQNQIR